jgi:lipoprotein NlpD
MPLPADTRPSTYTVKAGDTLYSIALEHGLDYREVAGWNNIENHNLIRVGQQLRLSAPTTGATTAPLKGPAVAVESRPLGATPSVSSAPVPPGNVRTEPRGVRVPYSDQAYAQMSRAGEPAAKPEVAKPEPKPEPKPEVVKPEAGKPGEDVDWTWPTSGKVIAGFNGTTSKGVDIGGKAGQPVLASGDGRVIFSGTGIRGLGKFVVIKHNNAYISVYAHNSELVVKQDQTVTRGQKIAEMGNTDTDQVKLHFEIRRFGTPVDPLRFLPER